MSQFKNPDPKVGRVILNAPGPSAGTAKRGGLGITRPTESGHYERAGRPAGPPRPNRSGCV
jgi:hypothetical protein